MRECEARLFFFLFLEGNVHKVLHAFHKIVKTCQQNRTNILKMLLYKTIPSVVKMLKT